MLETPESSKQFFVVWSPQGGEPVARFRTFEAARYAAYRLSERCPEQDFFVLRTCWGKLGSVSQAAEQPIDPTPEPTP